ncbi:MAG: site-specific DNA-methyltransferase, partial [Pseudomonadota bacterium]|nr:site-specific DNA-methyltransferase [Pseudomonadota bacterium]
YFFAGSGSTGHGGLAVKLAAGGGRRFRRVQRGYPTGEPRWPTIADITRERLRRAAEALGSEEGFRAWRLVSPGRAGSRSGTPPR